MEVRPGLHISSVPAYSQSIGEDPGRPSHAHSSVTLVAKEALVHAAIRNGNSQTGQATVLSEDADSRQEMASESSQLGFDGVAFERQELTRLGLLDSSVHTLLASRKPTTEHTYHRIWEKFREWCLQSAVSFSSPSESTIVNFLQSGLEKDLSLATLKVQISALSALTKVKWADQPLVSRFLQGVKRLKPQVRPVVPSWDLNLVLQALVEPPFEPLESIPMELLSMKAAFLIAITSARRVVEIQALLRSDPYLKIHQDKVVLRLSEKFLPKVVSSFHASR
uniref:Core-binding (CB) domain-containing protein n=1 Tax=Xenopus tropicalis TaxID=8364 RepID=A0A803JB94_XENTR